MTIEIVRCDRTPAWAALEQHFEGSGRDFDVRQAFAGDPGRFAAFSMQAPEVFADLSKHRWDGATRRLLLQLARECKVEARRDAMFAGEPINTTEGRAVLHVALRMPAGPTGLGARTDEAVTQVHEVLEPMLAFAERVRAQAGTAFTDVVNIGIGGSDLGPQMAVLALDEFVHRALRFHYVSNVDGHDIASLLRGLDPAKTLFIVASKTFTTQETLTNAAIAKDWFQSQGGTDVAGHFIGVTTNLEAAAKFGVTTTFGFRDWVGGRYSLWSAIGLSIAIAVGADGFRELLAGAHAMDEHFRTAPLEANLPLQLALVDIWYRNFHGYTSRSVAPYHQALKRLPAYLQQLEMESNGKRVDLAGEFVPFGTSPVVWGEPGTNGQHAYFQMLHQGTDVVPVEFIAVRRAGAGQEGLLAESHTKLLANCLAQSQALMQGKTAAEAATESAPTAAPDLPPSAVAAHRSFSGNRPSTTLVLEALTPRSLGALIALYEHRVFCDGAMWGINSFDQWGVELGKALASALLPRMASGDVAGLDGSTAGLLQRLRA
ncbi:MAG TPA: glucose-6-phosphate isomerase [Burkholderiaceae bacterium]|nr:glucose-6-phosphate isomerase [Burkholderiaceae bacterium]